MIRWVLYEIKEEIDFEKNTVQAVKFLDFLEEWKIFQLLPDFRKLNFKEIKDRDFCSLLIEGKIKEKKQ